MSSNSHFWSVFSNELWARLDVTLLKVQNFWPLLSKLETSQPDLKPLFPICIQFFVRKLNLIQPRYKLEIQRQWNQRWHFQSLTSNYYNLELAHLRTMVIGKCPWCILVWQHSWGLKTVPTRAIQNSAMGNQMNRGNSCTFIRLAKPLFQKSLH